MSRPPRCAKRWKQCSSATRDGGHRFETIREGLPQSDCYDLVYRHGLDIDAAGVRFV